MGDATDRLVAVFQTFGGDALRDVWLFDQWTYEQLYAREDIDGVLDELDIERFVDNERYGYVTRNTYESLYYADYEYTIRGFTSFEQFRMFLSNEETRIGVFASFDRQTSTGYDFGSLHGDIQSVADDYPLVEFTPVGGPE